MYRTWAVHRGNPLYLAYVQACTAYRANTGYLGMGDLLTQIWVESLISRARMRPPVYTRTRIMRARGRAHAPARGGKSLTCSRISYFAYAVLGIALNPGY